MVAALIGKLWPEKDPVTPAGPYIAGAGGAVAPTRKTKCFFSNMVFDFAGIFLVAILVRNLKKTD